ncbi:hypothetical protein CAC42_4019 [Sphaceloma murrayae]|uniref:Nucleoporin nup82 n=1 Tax=Sphaceloma murrayae TaxID=2082308 RepID=A0A2K1QT06_9PEZI|nr:hypothetical protein CAC42_4019 [Sphaceloma murrayae]
MNFLMSLTRQISQRKTQWPNEAPKDARNDQRMMNITGHTPAWLSRPSTGFQVFQPAEKSKAQSTLSNGYGKKIESRGPLKTLAHRGTEVFYVVENEIRWTDLVALKEAGDDGKGKTSKVLKAPVAGQIRQLVVSPLGDYLAIVTSHTVHVAILPTKLDNFGETHTRLKTFQLGPTAHVLEQAPLASVIWHPFGALGSCLVTVATDACVRLWELNTENRHSFDEPALAVDMKKLANASSYGEDMRASVYGTSKGFSPDLVEMEVAAACFGGIGSSDETGWAPMTLWVAMTEGDIYALCPLLPSKWQPASSTIPSLSTNVVSKASILDYDPNTQDEERRQAMQQQKWLADIDSQDPLLELLPSGLGTVEVYQRPSHPPAIPKLQGPFQLSPEPDLGDISDLMVISPRLDDELLDEDDEDEYGEPAGRPGLSIGLVCLLTKTSTVHICLDLNGVEAKWLPSRRLAFQTAPAPPDDTSLLVLESVELSSDGDVPGWPTLTPIIKDRYLASEPLYEQHPGGRYSFLVTQASGVHSLTLTPWIQNLEEELCGPSNTGSSFRISLLHESERSLITSLISIPTPSPSTPAALSVIDSDLSHFVFTLSSHQPYSASIDITLDMDPIDPYAPSAAQLLLPSSEVREPYIPARDFFVTSQLPNLIDQTLNSSSSRLKRTDITSQVRLSPATLQLFTEAHRILSDETNRLGIAAADLFRRCQRMQAELAEQVRQVREIRDRAEDVGGKEKLEARMKGVRERDEKLQKRVEAVRRKVAGLQGGTMSKREEAWGMEAKEVEDSLEGQLEERVRKVKELKDGLVGKAKAVKDATEGNREEGSRVPSEIRRKKLDQ